MVNFQDTSTLFMQNIFCLEIHGWGAMDFRISLVKTKNGINESLRYYLSHKVTESQLQSYKVTELQSYMFRELFSKRDLE